MSWAYFPGSFLAHSSRPIMECLGRGLKFIGRGLKFIVGSRLHPGGFYFVFNCLESQGDRLYFLLPKCLCFVQAA